MGCYPKYTKNSSNSSERKLTILLKFDERAEETPHQKNTQVAHKNMKRCSMSYFSREMEIKATMS